MANFDESPTVMASPPAGNDRMHSQAAPAGLLEQIVDHLPIALTVQDHDGRFILANAAAAANLEIPLDSLIGASPADFLDPAAAADRREWEMNLMLAGQSSTVEEKIAGPRGEQTWLTWYQPARLRDRTGLPNRIRIREHVDRILRDQERRFALAFIDLDNFKHINDYYSHAVGDALLLKIAKRIAMRLRDSDMLARISGDEFLLLLDPIEDDDQIGTIVEQILADLKQPFHIEAFEVFTSASIGVSMHPDHGLSYEELRRNADSAMYRAKSESKGDAVYFDLNMGQAITVRMEHEQRLRLAIQDCRFCCAFQPKMDIRGQAVVGFRRWCAGATTRARFTRPAVHRSGHRARPDRHHHAFVLAETLRSILKLDQEFGPATSLQRHVAAKRASDLNFMRAFTAILRAEEFAPRIMIELTEDAFVAKSQFQMHIFHAARARGSGLDRRLRNRLFALSALADITADELRSTARSSRLFTSARAARRRAAGDRSQPCARHDHRGGGRGDVRGARLSAGGDAHPLRPGVIFQALLSRGSRECRARELP